MDFLSPLTLILLINSLVIIVLILNQNDNTKDSVSYQNSSSSNNPLENITWISFILQLSLLLIKIKTTDF
jgi:preprotein translocase subunit SecG